MATLVERSSKRAVSSGGGCFHPRLMKRLPGTDRRNVLPQGPSGDVKDVMWSIKVERRKTISTVTMEQNPSEAGFLYAVSTKLHSTFCRKRKAPAFCMCDPQHKHQGRQLFWLSELQVRSKRDHSQPTCKLMAIMFAQTRREFD